MDAIDIPPVVPFVRTAVHRARLTPRERALLEVRYAAPDGTITPARRCRLQDIADAWGISAPRVRQIETAALRKLRVFRTEVADRARYQVLWDR